MIRKCMANRTCQVISSGYTLWFARKVYLANLTTHAWTGPFKVVKKISDVNYRIQQLHAKERGKQNILIT